MFVIPKHRPPTHPGEMLSEEFLKPLGITQSDLARRMGVPLQRINLLINRKRGITPDTALRLSRLLGTTPEFWLLGQIAWDLYHQKNSAKARDIARIVPIGGGK